MKLGNEYINKELFARTNNPIEVIKGIIQIGIQSNHPDFSRFCSGLQRVNWDNMATGNQIDKDLEVHVNKILRSIDAVAPLNTEFKQGGPNGAWGFWSNDVNMNNDISTLPDPNMPQM